MFTRQSRSICAHGSAHYDIGLSGSGSIMPVVRSSIQKMEMTFTQLVSQCSLKYMIGTVLNKISKQ